jgi:hypothetical protein
MRRACVGLVVGLLILSVHAGASSQSTLTLSPTAPMLGVLEYPKGFWEEVIETGERKQDVKLPLYREPKPGSAVIAVVTSPETIDGAELEHNWETVVLATGWIPALDANGQPTVWWETYCD